MDRELMSASSLVWYRFHRSAQLQSAAPSSLWWLYGKYWNVMTVVWTRNHDTEMKEGESEGEMEEEE